MLFLFLGVSNAFRAHLSWLHLCRYLLEQEFVLCVWPGSCGVSLRVGGRALTQRSVILTPPEPPSSHTASPALMHTASS